MPATFSDHEVKSKLKEKRRLSAFLDQLVMQHKKDVMKTSLSYIFCSDDYLLTINTQYLNHDTFTDIITFDLSDVEHKLIGEIYVSVDRVKENAARFETSYNDELHRVIFHGALHLCGFKDKTKKDEELMRTMENMCLESYFKHEE